MGIYDRQYYQGESSGFQLRLPQTITGRLLLLNIVLFLLGVTFFKPDRQGGGIEWTSMFSWGMLTSDTWRQPWFWYRYVSYGFLHDPFGVGHILGNMFGLFFFGREIESLYGGRKFLRFYLSALILPGVVWSMLNLALGDTVSQLMGASGAVTAVLILFVLHFPRRTIYLNFLFPIPAWVLGVFIIGSNLLSSGSTSGGMFRIAVDVHLAGAAYALVFFKTHWELGQLIQPGSWSFWKRPSWTVRPKLKIHRPSSGGSRGLAEQADAILEKLHREGEASLTARERTILEEYSRRVRQGRD